MMRTVPSAPAATRATLAFVSRFWAALAFGFLLAFGSSVGQSYFIGLFGANIRADLGLTHGAFGGIYSAATLASAGSLLFVGKLTDHLSARAAALVTTIWLAGAATLMAFAVNALMLGAALFALRLGGQGMMSHIALTTLGRWFQRERGRAVALATLGFPTAEALLPPLVAIALVKLGAMSVWLIAAGLMIALVAPALFILATLAGRAQIRAAAAADPSGPGDETQSWTRAQVLKDPRFYAICPGLLAAPFIVTGLLFHQSRLVEINAWTLSGFAALFPLFAGAAVASGLLTGALADRYGSRRVLPAYLAPLGVALLLFSVTDSLVVAAFCMALVGVTAGGATVLFGTVWAELYGLAHLGSIRALAVSLMVFATALGPGAMGLLIDLGVGLDAQFQGLAGYVAACIAALFWLQPRLIAKPPPIPANGAARQ
ncbi:MFS transporter [Maricaulaceae bacterium MS644]